MDLKLCQQHCFEGPLGVGIQQEEVGQREHGHSSTPEASYLALCFPVNQDGNDSFGNLAFPTIMD